MKNLTLLVLTSTILFACKTPPERILIKLNKGQKYEQRIVLKSTITQTVSGRKMSTSTTSQGLNRYEVLAVDDSVYTFQVTYQSMKVHIEVDGGPTTQLKTPTTAVLEKLKGQSYQVKVTNTGRIVAVIGADSLFSKVTASIAGLTEEMRAKLSQNFIKAYGDSAIKSGNLQYANIYPQKIVKGGDTWRIQRAGGGDILSPAIDAIYKMDKITSHEYLVSMKSKLRLGSDVSSSPLFGLNMSGIMDSKNKIDKETGLITESKIKQDMIGSATILAGTPAMIGDSILMQIKGETTLINTLIK
ncbi:DUF6263 family protein [Pedobacter panaciterrae]|uniref:DUF6263 family protein n=1 Tax=Pedobacter panaciterrae TaxID=363849 RepID=A0ABU8NHP3_9SPHI|nr:DUF6263 family protein [uncultured Pedobacter sp.]